VVPDAQQRDPVVLAGEIPDPTRVPAGCRFHPRCPALASGAASSVAEACRSTPLAVLPATDAHVTSCHLVAAGDRAGPPPGELSRSTG
jgi:oligopeptide/dipeptide ABC transporter ATP-binding protein